MTQHGQADVSYRKSRRSRTAPVAFVLVLAASMALVACSNGDSSSSGDDAQASTQRYESAPDDGALDDGALDDGTATLTAAQQLGPTAAAERLQTFTASTQLRVESLEDAVADASAAIEQLGGFAASEDVDLARANTATLVYRVPAAEFRPALSVLAGVGELREQTIDSSDVTAQYADLEARVKTLRTSIDRLQGFLSETTDVNQIASLEGELTRREAELESIEGQRRVLADQVALSTITVGFDATTDAAGLVTATDRPGFMGGLEKGWNVALDVGSALLATLGFLLPFIPVALVGALGIRFLVRRSRTPRTPVEPDAISG